MYEEMKARANPPSKPPFSTDASVSLPIETKKYVRYLTEQAMLQFFVIVTVKETQQVFIKLHNFRFKLPVVDIVCPAQLTLGASFRVKLKFKNNLPFSLSHVRFLVEGKGLCPMRELSHKYARKRHHMLHGAMGIHTPSEPA